jgi:hypothetical protein
MCSEPHIPRQRDSCLTSNVRQIGKMESQADKLQILDLPVAAMLTIMGICGILYSKKNAELTEKKVASGEYTKVEAQKKIKTFRLCSYAMTAIGACLLLSFLL